MSAAATGLGQGQQESNPAGLICCATATVGAMAGINAGVYALLAATLTTINPAAAAVFGASSTLVGAVASGILSEIGSRFTQNQTAKSFIRFVSTVIGGVAGMAAGVGVTGALGYAFGAAEVLVLLIASLKVAGIALAVITGVILVGGIGYMICAD